MKALLSFFCFVLASANVQAQIQYFDGMDVKVLVTFNNQVVDAWARIDLKNPSTGKNVGWGTFAHYTNNARTKTNCNNDLYDYCKADIDPAWQSNYVFVIDPTTGAEGVFPGVTANINHNKAYWDEYYAGYTGPANGEPKCDYSQNCHGFAFGVGDWPDKALELIDAQVQGNPPPPGGGNQVSCYVGCDTDVATVATDINNHSIKIEGGVCVEQGTGGPPPPPPVNLKVVKKSWEQCRESGTYRREAGACPDSLNLNKAHAAHGQLIKEFYGPFALGTYKKNQ